MTTILRKIVERNVGSSYLKYAAGEIILIVAGILIALSLSDWSDRKKNERYEKLLLSEIYNYLKTDRGLIDSAYLPRLEAKETGVHKLMEKVGERSPISEADFIRFVGGMLTEFYFYYEPGPYESLKSGGLDRLSNAELRTSIIRFYESILPRYKVFFDWGDDYQPQKPDELLSVLISTSVNKNSDDLWEISPVLAVDEPLKHPSFLELLSMHKSRVSNDRSRLNFVIEEYDKIITEIEIELGK